VAAKTSFESAELSELIEKQKWQGLKVVILSYSLNLIFGVGITITILFKG